MIKAECVEITYRQLFKLPPGGLFVYDGDGPATIALMGAIEKYMGAIRLTTNFSHKYGPITEINIRVTLAPDYYGPQEFGKVELKNKLVDG
jgi:hypothetical protein